MNGLNKVAQTKNVTTITQHENRIQLARFIFT